jgi:hypothetical protein
MGFPQETIEFAKKKANELKKGSKDKLDLAIALYLKDYVNYGYGEAVLSGKFLRFPHEVDKEHECLENAVRKFVIAQQLGLNPRFFQVFGYREGISGIRRSTPIRYDHAFIDVDTGRKRRILIDNQLGLFGRVTYKESSIVVQQNWRSFNTVRDFDELVELTEEQIVERINYLRTPEGALSMLATGQNLFGFSTSFGYALNMVKYVFAENILESHITMSPPISANKALINRMQLDEKGRVKDSVLEFSTYTESSWMDYIKFTSFASLPLEAVLALKEIPEVAEQCKDRKKDNLLEFLVGLCNDQRGHKQMKNLLELLSAQYELLTKDDEKFEKIKRSLEFSGIYHAALDNAIASGTAHNGYIFPEEVRNRKFLQEINKRFELESEINELNKQYLLHILGLSDKNYRLRNKLLAAYRKRVDIKASLDSLKHFKIFKTKEYHHIMDAYEFEQQLNKGVTADSFLETSKNKLSLLDEYLKLCQIFVANSLVCMKGLTIPRYLPKISQKIAEYHAQKAQPLHAQEPELEAVLA